MFKAIKRNKLVPDQHPKNKSRLYYFQRKVHNNENKEPQVKSCKLVTANYSPPTKDKDYKSTLVRRETSRYREKY